MGHDLLALDLFLLRHFQFCHFFLLYLDQATLTFFLSINHPMFVPNAEPWFLTLPLPGTVLVHHCNQHSHVSGPGSPALTTLNGQPPAQPLYIPVPSHAPLGSYLYLEYHKGSFPQTFIVQDHVNSK